MPPVNFGISMTDPPMAQPNAFDHSDPTPSGESPISFREVPTPLGELPLASDACSTPLPYLPL